MKSDIVLNDEFVDLIGKLRINIREGYEGKFVLDPQGNSITLGKVDDEDAVRLTPYYFRHSGTVSANRLTGKKVSTKQVSTDHLDVGIGNPGEDEYRAGIIKVNNDEGKVAVKVDGENGTLHFNKGGIFTDHEPMIYIYSIEDNNLEDDSDTNDSSSNIKGNFKWDNIEIDKDTIEIDKDIELNKIDISKPVMVVAVSPQAKEKGIKYNGRNKIIIQENDELPVLTVDMEKQNVGIGTDKPDADLDVRGQAKFREVVETSDVRCKENIDTIDGALDKLQRLRGIQFQWKQDEPKIGDTDGNQRLGFIAQEVQDVLPEAVTEDQDGYYSLSYSSIVPVMVEAVKEQQKTIDKQAEEIKALQEKFQHLMK